MNTHLRPHITEKTLADVSRGWFTFKVPTIMTKHVAASSIEAHYNVNVIAIRSLIMQGKAKRAGRKMKQVKKSDWKKVRVLLKKGQKIDAFESMNEPSHQEDAKALKTRMEEKTGLKNMEAPKTDVQTAPKTERRRGDYAK